MCEVTGSDHAPVWCRANVPRPKLPEHYQPPCLSSQFLFKGHPSPPNGSHSCAKRSRSAGKQKTLDAFLVTRPERTSDSQSTTPKRVRKRRRLARQPTLRSFLAPSKSSTPSLEESSSSQDAIQKASVTSKGLTGVWKEFFAKQGPPLCEGHQEPCVVRHVKKSGANKGRRFYVCARPAGRPPIGRCDHFQWAS